jgi:hypothetical protein
LTLPFTVQQFFEVFTRYNRAVWPAPVVLLVLAAVSLALVLWRPDASSRAVSAILAGLWAWMGIAYHALFFTAINPAARAFAVFFLVQAVLFAVPGAVRGRLVFGRPSPARGALGSLLVAYSLAVYPALGWLAGHRYPAVPTFGAPCPTTIFTLGMLLYARPGPPWWLAAIPLAWAAVGSSAAFALGVSEDFGLLAAGVVVLAALLWPGRRSDGVS